MSLVPFDQWNVAIKKASLKTTSQEMFSIQTEIFKFQIFKNGHQINYFQLNNEAEVIYNGKNKERSQIPKKRRKETWLN